MAAESDLDKVKAELICSICLDLLSEPKKLDCDHSFCQKCLETHIHKSSPHTPIPPDPANDTKGRVLICACCQQKTSLPDNGVEGLKTNFKLKNLVEILSVQEREQTLQALGKGHHQKTGQTVPTCTEQGHERERCVFFCQDCNKLLCRYCLREHSQHKWDNYDSVLLLYKEEIRGSIQPAYEAAQSAHNAMQELEKDKDAVVQNRNSVKDRVREYFSQLAAELEKREDTIMKMADRYAEVKMEQLQKHCDQLKKGHMALVQNIQKIESQMQEDSVELLIGKDGIKTKMVAHRNTIRAALPKTEDVDTFIEFELKVESQVPVDTLGHLVFCQRNPCSGLVSTVRKFVESTDMDHIHLDLARPSDLAIEVPAYMEFRYKPPPLIDDDTYEQLSPATPVAPSGHSKNTPRTPLPPVPVEQGAAVSSTARDYELYSKVANESGEANIIGRKRVESANSDEDPYDTIPAFNHHTLPSSQTNGSRPAFSTMPRELPAPTKRPSLIQPLQVIDLRNNDVQPSGIGCTHRYSNLVITDTNNKCLQILGKGEVIHTIGAPEFMFKKPVALAIDRANHIFVLDQQTKTVYKLSLSGDLISSFSTKPRRGPEKPWDIAISPDEGNAIYISDWSRKRVYIYDGATGNKIRSIKGFYKRERKDEFVRFLRPAGIAFDRGGHLMIADRGERCVWSINTEGDELIMKIGEGHLQNPYSIAISQDGKVFVTESELDCVSVFSEVGELLYYFGGPGLMEGQLCRPHHVFVDDNMKIYVADTQNKRVQIFALPEETRIYENLHLI